MPNPRTAAEWAEKCNQDYLTSMRVEGRSNGHLRHGLCLTCADAYARQQVEATSEHIEIVAHAIFDRVQEDQNDLTEWDDVDEETRQAYRREARAAIRALEATPGANTMIDDATLPWRDLA